MMDTIRLSLAGALVVMAVYGLIINDVGFLR